MRRNAVAALVGAAWMGAAVAGPGDFRLEVGSSRPDGSEDTALHGYVLLQPGATHSRAVGTVGRAYSVSGLPDNTVWGVVTEAINFPSAIGSVVGTESAVVNMAPGNAGELRGLDIVFKDRLDASIDQPVPNVGDNRFNESSAAVYVSSQPRSPAGEYSGWQAGIRFGRSSLDRSASRPWTAALDVSEVQVDAPFYLVVWRCGLVRCGLRLTADGPVTVADIDRMP
ncbi:MAG TPA: hypothetical protein VFE23_05475 [Usitatibacter sp.]|nr:hypothetical protein [Usitatibacter sp.]